MRRIPSEWTQTRRTMADYSDPQWLSHFELLVRSLLIRPDEPAVVILGHFAPQIQIQNGFVGPELLHTVVAQFYDVPHLRQVVVPLAR